MISSKCILLIASAFLKKEYNCTTIFVPATMKVNLDQMPFILTYCNLCLQLNTDLAAYIHIMHFCWD